MLEELRISNFAIIENLTVQFHDGLNVITGETGAGKSIIIGALNLVLGGRADTDTIRSGQSSATVEAVFRVNTPDLVPPLQEMGLELDEGCLIVRRVISQQGKNKVYLNGAPVTVAQLSQVGDCLVDIHGQHDHQSLLHPETHVGLLDRFGKLQSVRADFDRSYSDYQAVVNKLRQARARESDRLQRQDLLEFQIQEIDAAGISPNEDEELKSEKNKLAHSEKLNLAIENALDGLVEREDAVLAILGRVRRELEPLTQIDPGLESTSARSDTAFFEVESLIEELRDYQSGLEFDPKRLEEIEDRLAEINGLKRKYGNDINAILEHRNTIGEELDALTLSEEELKSLDQDLSKRKAELTRCAGTLAEKREKAAADLKKKAEKELAELSMKQVHFSVRLDYPEEDKGVEFKKRKVRLTPDGLGEIEFVFSPNPGEDPRPLAKIASGGELSRVMLSLKSLLNKQSPVPVMVFDEVDAGISGSVAEKVGQKLRKIADGKQVFCITHLPQIAGMAQAHFRVQKTVAGKRTRSLIEELEHDQRVEEIARLSGGETITETTLQYAREMIKNA